MCTSGRTNYILNNIVGARTFIKEHFCSIRYHIQPHEIIRFYKEHKFFYISQKTPSFVLCPYGIQRKILLPHSFTYRQIYIQGGPKKSV